jgi:hypothetical protein
MDSSNFINLTNMESNDEDEITKISHAVSKNSGVIVISFVEFNKYKQHNSKFSKFFYIKK